MSPKETYGIVPACVDLEKLSGTLVVIEGPDSSGRSTQIAILTRWLEEQGYAVAQVGLRRSSLVGPELEQAKEGNILSPRTLSLFYATDFYDQLENRIVPALRAGFVVLADRYIYTLMARAVVRGAEPEWLASVYSMAIVPDAVFYMSVTLKTLVQRTFQSHTELDYWESGMDCGLSRDWFQSFVRYQRKIRSEFFKMQRRYGFELINANRTIAAVDRDLRGRIQLVLSRTEKPAARRGSRGR
jgi:dTMP kinase